MIRPPDPIMRQCRQCGRTGPDAFGRCRCGAEYGRLTIGLDRPADPPAQPDDAPLTLTAAQLDGGWAGPWPDDEQEDTGCEA